MCPLAERSADITRRDFVVQLMGKSIAEDNELNSIKAIDKGLVVSTGKAVLQVIPFFGELIASSGPDIYKYFKNKAFLEFLQGLEIGINSEKFSEEDGKTFAEKLENAENYLYLSTIFDSVFFSKSKKARLILGIIAAKYINSESIPYEDLLIVTSLKDLLDVEIDCFLEIYDVAKHGGKEDGNGPGAFFISFYPDQTTMNTTFCKLQSLHIIGSKAESLTSKSPGSWHGNVTSITERFKYYIDLLPSV